MNPSPLISALVNYTRVLHEARSPRVVDWDASFVDRCAEWCAYIETEISLLPESKLEHCQQQAQQQLDQLPLPSLCDLSDALHQFYLTLIANPSVSHDLYRYLLSTFVFINHGASARENLVLDLARMAKKVTMDSVLDDMERVLMGNDDHGQGGS